MTEAAPAEESLVERLEAGVCNLTLRFGSGAGVEDLSASELWKQAEASAAWFVDRDEPVGAVITNSVDSVVTLLGAFRAGATLLSLPLPARPFDVGHYQTMIARITEHTGAESLLADDAYLPLLPPGEGLRCLRHREAKLAGPITPRHTAERRFVQFSSGSEGDPKGVVLRHDQLSTAASIILRALDAGPKERIVSWLPLSHDMGLVGSFLTAWIGSADRSDVSLTLMAPEDFIRDPAIWIGERSNRPGRRELPVRRPWSATADARWGGSMG